MTQEELDALMAGDIDLDTVSEEEPTSEDTDVETEEPSIEEQQEKFRVDPNSSWPPPPPTEDHQVVNQLDGVTKDSEIKATEIFDKLEAINDMTMNVETAMTEQVELLKNNIDIFERLSNKFTEIESFKTALEESKRALEKSETALSQAQDASNEVMLTMDIMQYQDIHRQKIERVINVMRTLSQYMSSLFDSNVADSDRVTSAVHIEGDNTTDVVNEDDIEALIASFGN